MMFFNKKKTHGIPLGIVIGAVAGIAGATAIAVSNREVRKTMKKEWSKYCRRGSSALGLEYFCK